MKSKFFFSNKKAIAEFVLDIWSYLVFIIALFLFFGLFYLESVKATERQLRGATEAPESFSGLLNYLRTPIEVEIDGAKRNMNMADLIVLSEIKHEEETERGKLALAKSHDILDATVGEEKWAVNVCYPKGREST